MVERHQPTHEEIEMALSKAAREEVIKIAKSGFPVPNWENGRVVKTSPEEILAIHDPEARPNYEFADKRPPSIQYLIDKRPEQFKYRDSDVSILDEIKLANRAITFFSVDWSGPERKRRKAFFHALGRLHTLVGYRQVAAYVLDEENATIRQFFRSKKAYYSEHPLGAGSLFWLEKGQIVSSAEHGYDYAEEILTKTFCIWPNSEAGL
jgi:hypothetical protein